MHCNNYIFIDFILFIIVEQKFDQDEALQEILAEEQKKWFQ